MTETVNETATPIGNDASIEDLITAVNALTKQQAEIADMLGQVVAQLEPTLNAIKSSPIGKILGV